MAAEIRTIDMQLIDDLFDMGGGYVLYFNDGTFAAFFDEELGVNIDDPRYSAEGTSKAKRLRYFLKSCAPSVRVRALTALWEYRQAHRRRNRIEERIPEAEAEFGALIERLGGRRPARTGQPSTSETAPTQIDASVSHALRDSLLEISRLAPQARGYAYERFLKNLFDVHGLSPRASFRLVGEQIDGSFELSGETYLLEAKWEADPIGVADLHAFNGKVEEKAAWSRGLLVSHSGFTEDGLAAFGRAKRVVCMDGLDLHAMLDQRLSFSDVMARKVRRAAESGSPFIRVRDLFG